jgi:hypothetical protein
MSVVKPITSTTSHTAPKPKKEKIFAAANSAGKTIQAADKGINKSVYLEAVFGNPPSRPLLRFTNTHFSPFEMARRADIALDIQVDAPIEASAPASQEPKIKAEAEAEPARVKTEIETAEARTKIEVEPQVRAEVEPRVEVVPTSKSMGMAYAAVNGVVNPAFTAPLDQRIAMIVTGKKPQAAEGGIVPTKKRKMKLSQRLEPVGQKIANGYRGFKFIAVSQIARNIPFALAVPECVKFSRQHIQDPMLAKITAYAFASTIEGIVTTPMARIIQAIQTSPTGIDPYTAAKQIIQREGWKAMGKGAGMTTVRNAMFNPPFFITLEAYKTWREKGKKPSELEQVFNSFVGGALASTVALPFSTPANTLMMRMRDNPQAKSGLKLGMQILKTEGVPGLYRGMGSGLVRMQVSGAVGGVVMLGLNQALNSYEKNHKTFGARKVEKLEPMQLVTAAGM